MWHEGLLFKLKLLLPYYLIIRSFLKNRTFIICYGNILSPDLFNVYTTDIPKTPNNILTIYVDHAAILLPRKDLVDFANSLQTHLNLIDDWSSKWNIKINSDKLIYIPFTLDKSKLFPL